MELIFLQMKSSILTKGEILDEILHFKGTIPKPWIERLQNLFYSSSPRLPPSLYDCKRTEFELRSNKLLCTYNTGLKSFLLPNINLFWGL